uniref:non-specific serine/threonine protein kinase n=1 Tax=Steinernema glaseri TaxID=37863 RepID=A0A1I7ZCD4_9BILA
MATLQNGRNGSKDKCGVGLSQEKIADEEKAMENDKPAEQKTQEVSPDSRSPNIAQPESMKKQGNLEPHQRGSKLVVHDVLYPPFLSQNLEPHQRGSKLVVHDGDSKDVGDIFNYKEADIKTARDPAIPEMPPSNQKAKAGARKPRGKYAAPHLKVGTMLKRRFLVGPMRNGGSFGQIFTATDQAENKTVVVKVGPDGPGSGRMILEQHVLKALRGTVNAPTLIGSGMHKGFMFIIMEMLGRNLTDLRKRQERRRFSTNTAIRATMQGLQAIETLHNIGYIHRDIKPTNMVIGCSGLQKSIVYLLDYGMVRQHRFEDGTIRKGDSYACFHGTVRYASLNIHDMKEVGPVDDLWSLFYTMIELGEGSLPWRHSKEEEVTINKKRNTPLKEYILYLPIRVLEFAKYLQDLNYTQKPDYQHLQNLLYDAMESSTKTMPLDWENQQYEGPEEPSS